jgi:protoporphyrinogen oxidase
MEVGLSLMHVLRELDVGRSFALGLLRRGGRLAPPAACSFRSGMQALPRALAAKLGDRVRLSTHVSGIAKHPTGWQLATAAGTVHAEHVVLTTPAGAAARLLADAEPAAATALGALTYNPLAVVHLDAETELRGLGFQVSFTEHDRALRGVTYNASPHRRLRFHDRHRRTRRQLGVGLQLDETGPGRCGRVDARGGHGCARGNRQHGDRHDYAFQ